MKKIILLALLFSLFSSLHAYSKKIIFSAFSNMENAQRSLQGFKETKSYQKLDALAKANNFIIHARVSGRYYIVVAEPFYSEGTAQEAFRLGKKEYRNAYMNTYEAPTKPEEKIVINSSEKKIEKPIETVKVVEKDFKELQKVQEPLDQHLKEKESQETQEIEKNDTKQVLKELNSSQETKKVEVKVTEIEKIVAEHNKTKKSIQRTKEFAFSVLDILLYAFLLIILGVIIFYSIKFKRVYDEY